MSDVSWKRAALGSTFRMLDAIGVMPTVRRVAAGRGTILMFHEIQKDPSRELMTGTSVAFLDRILGWLTQHGWDLVNLDEALKRLDEERHTRPFVSITFDDGYRDNLTLALPVLESHRSPFTVFVPTAAVDRSLDTWWLCLRALFLQNDEVTIEPMERRFASADFADKLAGFTAVQNWVRQDLGRSRLLRPAFDAAGISSHAINEHAFMTAAEVRTLANHPLASIGAHSTSHPVLSRLSANGVERELVENRRFLEELLQQSVEHLAYPYGSPQACGAREATIVERLGFRSAVTTQFQKLSGNTERWLLPRLAITAGRTLERFAAQMNGLLFPGQKAAAVVTPPATRASQGKIKRGQTWPV